MTTTTNDRSDSQAVPSWAAWLIGIALVVLFIWLWNTANTAKSIAEENAALLARPELEAVYVVGGPTRFGERFADAADGAEIEGFDSADFLWSTAIVSNEGAVDADDVRLTAELQPDAMPTILADLPSFGLNLESSREAGTVEVDMRDIDEGESALVFFGFRRDSIPDEQASAWPTTFGQMLARLTVETGETTEVVYGRGL
jgi:hypothetical protein